MIAEESLREAKPLSYNPFPLSLKGEGDKGGEVDKHSNNWGGSQWQKPFCPGTCSKVG